MTSGGVAAEATRLGTHASLIQRLRVAYRFYFDKFYLDNWQSWRDHFQLTVPDGTLLESGRCVSTRTTAVIDSWKDVFSLIAPGVEKGRKPPNYASPLYELIFFFSGRGCCKTPQRCINAAEPMLMRARLRVGASADVGQKSGRNFSSLIGGSGSWNSRSRFTIYDTFE